MDETSKQLLADVQEPLSGMTTNMCAKGSPIFSCLLSRWLASGRSRLLSAAFEFHYTPKHGSWLNMAEVELSALSRQCLAGRIADQEALAAEVKAWEEERNASVVKVHWRFTTADARIKLAHLDPRVQGC